VGDDSTVALSNPADVLEGNFDGATATHATTTVSLCVRSLLATVEMPIQAWLVRG
jgi:hypothetical protein